MNRAPGKHRVGWSTIAAVSGLDRVPDLHALLWPLLWSTWFAAAGALDPWRLGALLIAVVLARSAAWSAFAPKSSLYAAWRERRVLIFFFGVGALCFAAPLGIAGWLIVAPLPLLAAWFQIRRMTYLSDPLFAAAVALPVLAAWLAQDAALTKVAGLVWLAAFAWITAALVITPVVRDSASLHLLAERRATAAGAALQLLALFALALAGQHARLGLPFWLGLAVAGGCIGLASFAARAGRVGLHRAAEAGAGAAPWIALVVQFAGANP